MGFIPINCCQSRTGISTCFPFGEVWIVFWKEEVVLISTEVHLQHIRTSFLSIVVLVLKIYLF